MYEIKRRLYSKLLELNNRSIELFGVDLTGIKIKCELKGIAAGKYYPKRDLINLNRDLIQQYPDEMINNILCHEVAHHITYKLYGGRVKPHGKEWKEICGSIGGVPEIYHSLPTTKVKKFKRYRYICECGEHLLTSIRHNRIQKGVAYFCKKCKKKLSQVS